MKSEENKGLSHKDNVILRGEKHFGNNQNPSLSRSTASKNVQNKKGDFGFQPQIPRFKTFGSPPLKHPLRSLRRRRSYGEPRLLEKVIPITK